MVFVQVGLVLYTYEQSGSFLSACVNHATLGVHGKLSEAAHVSSSVPHPKTIFFVHVYVRFNGPVLRRNSSPNMLRSCWIARTGASAGAGRGAFACY